VDNVYDLARLRANNNLKEILDELERLDPYLTEMSEDELMEATIQSAEAVLVLQVDADSELVVSVEGVMKARQAGNCYEV
jgi:hypothetical protein